jgi:hypothetical protein
VTRELDAASKDVLVEHLYRVLHFYGATRALVRTNHAILRKKRRIADEHFVQKDAQSPPVHSLAVALVENNLGSKILRCAAQSPGPRSWLHVLGEAEVAQLQVARIIQQDVFRLEVAVEDVVGMKVLEHENNAGGCGVRREVVLCCVVEHIAPGGVELCGVVGEEGDLNHRVTHNKLCMLWRASVGNRPCEDG